MRKNSVIYNFIILSSLIFTACSSSKVMRMPREYVNNCYGQPQKMGGADFKKGKRGVWVVYSDRSNNPTYQNPGGRVQLLQSNFMESFIVQKQKGDYLRLIKYNPKIVLDGKIKDQKSVQYAGWMHKSHLLLANQSFTGQNGLKNKYATVFRDNSLFDTPELFMENDSLFTFSDANLTKRSGKTPLYEIVYRLKTTDNNKSSLIAKVPFLDNDSIAQQVIGWVDNSVLTNIGQHLHADVPPNADSLSMRTKSMSESMSFSNDEIWGKNEDVRLMKKTHKALNFSPVYVIKDVADSTFKINTAALRPVADRRNSFIYNINGHRIYYPQFLSILDDLKKINVIFAIENSANARRNLPLVANAIQTLESSFSPSPENGEDDFTYKFGVVLPYDGAQIGLVNDYSKMMDYVAGYVGDHTSYTWIPEAQKNWSSLRRAISMCSNYKNETNLIVSVGESANENEVVDPQMVWRLANNNCSVIGFQMYSQRTNSDNNFLLQLQDMILRSAKQQANLKKERIVYSDQAVQENYFTEVAQNTYLLNYPDSSMALGGIVFPEKSRYLDMGMIETYVDTLLVEMKSDNSLMANSLRMAFHDSGNNNLKYDPMMRAYFNLTDTLSPNINFMKSFNNDTPVWYMPVLSVETALSKDVLNFDLLLSDDELQKLQRTLEGLSKSKLDYVNASYTSTTSNQKLYNYNNEFDAEQIPLLLGEARYKSTRAARKYLRNYLLEKMNEGHLCPRSKGELKKYPVSKALLEITKMPVQNDTLINNLQVRRITSKRYLKDEQLDAMIRYFKLKSKELNKSIPKLPKFKSNGEKYYWVDERLMP